MAQRPPQSASTVPFWRDVRVLGVVAQLALAVVLLLGVGWIGRNALTGLVNLGRAQFQCEDGSVSFRCAFNFMYGSASFDIGEKPIDYVTTDTYWRALEVGLLNTAKVAVAGIILATLLGVATGVAVLSSNWLLHGLAAVYIDIIRNTPLLVQLFFIYFAVILQLPGVKDSLSPGLGISLNQRGFFIPWPAFNASALPWLAFIVLGIVQFQVLWVILGQREERTGRPSNRLWWAAASALLVIAFGWFFSTRLSQSQSVLVTRASRVAQARDTLSGLEAIVAKRLSLAELSPAALAALDPADVTAAELKVCVVRNSAAEENMAALLRGKAIPFAFVRFDRPDQAAAGLAGERCDAFAGERVVAAAERGGLENPNNYLVADLISYPIILSIPRVEGTNLVGGARLTPEFAALLFGLVLYTAAFIAEIVRAGILAVNRGQSEAARALGLSEGQRLRLVVLPQALRVIIPPLTSQYLNLTKNSSLAIAVGFPDLVAVTNTILNQSGRAIQVVVLVMLLYLAVSLGISALLNWYNQRVALVER